MWERADTGSLKMQKEQTQQARGSCSWRGPLARMVFGWHLGTWIWGGGSPLISRNEKETVPKSHSVV